MSLKVLYVEDDEDDFLLLSLALKRLQDESIKLYRAGSVAVAQQMIALDQFDILLIDYKLSPVFSEATGLELVEWLLHHGVRTPMMILSSADSLQEDPAIARVMCSRYVSFTSKSDLTPANIWATVLRTLADPLKVLIVDDDPDDAELIASLLQNQKYFSYQVSATGSLENARHLQKSIRPEVFIVDYMMGAHTSIKYIEELLVSDPACSVVLVTGNQFISQDGSARRVMARRKVSFLPKDLLSPELLTRAISSSRCRPLEETLVTV